MHHLGINKYQNNILKNLNDSWKASPFPWHTVIITALFQNPIIWHRYRLCTQCCRNQTPSAQIQWQCKEQNSSHVTPHPLAYLLSHILVGFFCKITFQTKPASGAPENVQYAMWWYALEWEGRTPSRRSDQPGPQELDGTPMQRPALA